MLYDRASIKMYFDVYAAAIKQDLKLKLQYLTVDILLNGEMKHLNDAPIEID